VQEARKSSGFDVSDRIALSWAVLDGPDATEVAEAVTEHGGLIGEEVLATTITRAEDATGLAHTDADLGLAFDVTRV
jgi:isoleucyl-tRNA synthetase